jgi:DNA-binding NtrC family response regulator
MATILCVDDEEGIRALLQRALTRLGHDPLLADSVEVAVNTVQEVEVDLILADYRMPGATGLDLLARCRELGFDIPFIIMTGYSSIEHAVTSIKQGAFDYLTKPVRVETLELAVNQAMEITKLRRENRVFRSEIAGMRAARAIVGKSPPMQAVLRTVQTVAPTRATVLLQGESGTGKELLARAIHDQSPRDDQPFVSLNCAAIPEGLVESAMFGHEKGAFTGASTRALGAFERAHRGTLLLDEISEMRLDLQPRLLRVIQEQEFERVGGRNPIKVDVRIIATTNRDLSRDVDEGRFREDLYYRLNVVPMTAPPLRERCGDIPLLVDHFARRAAAELGAQPPHIAPEAIGLLETHPWPGNIRELENVVHRAVILSEGTIGPEGFRPYLEERGARRVPAERDATDGAAVADEVVNLKDLEEIAIQQALKRTQGNRTQAARLLGISERTLRNKLNVKRRSP